MADILLQLEKEEIIDSFESWIELRELRNALEHDYPEELEQALNDLKSCVDSFIILENTYKKSLAITKRFFKDFNYEIK
ncbi:MAG: hypothetical protein PQJ61_05270 [Spirochaetales bacterium]|uniref:Uncharacterized protein n=1 Tax=Candidatus Thalassospirochaeta sargassi TaxID=3119039 RepID=A0AAJ1IBD5_9SPIO|nr:hypothetical protein [Spirochaetales bacterium]